MNMSLAQKIVLITYTGFPRIVRFLGFQRLALLGKLHYLGTDLVLKYIKRFLENYKVHFLPISTNNQGIF